MNNTKRCTCGNRYFNCTCLTQTYGTLDAHREWCKDAEFDEFATVGSYICTDCGKEYAKWNDIPDAPDAVGETGRDSFDAVFVEKQLDAGWNSADIVHMLHVLDTDEFFPIEVENSNGSSIATGIISKTAVEILNYDYSGLTACVRAILDDENPKDETYSLCGLKVVLTRDLAHFASQM